MIEHASGRGEGRVIEITYTHCLLRAALSLVCNHVHWLLDAAHCEHVGSTPSHLIFLRLGEGSGYGDQM